MKGLSILAPFWDTIQELSDSKKATIFLLGVFSIANADSLGFGGVSASYRLAAATALGAVWLISQAVVDTWGKKPDQQPK